MPARDLEVKKLLSCRAVPSLRSKSRWLGMHRTSSTYLGVGGRSSRGQPEHPYVVQCLDMTLDPSPLLLP